jgi:hypothetical protein
MTAQEKATQMARAFETRTRDNGTEYVALKDGSPDWMTDVARSAHDHARILPDDTRYDMIREVVAALADLEDWDDLHETIDGLVDIYTGSLTKWLASSNLRPGYCDEAIEELGDPGDMVKRIQYGQYREYEEIAQQVIEAINEAAANV